MRQSINTDASVSSSDILTGYRNVYQPLFLFLLLIFLVPRLGFSQDRWKLKGGINFSWLDRAQQQSQGIGYLVEIDRSLDIAKLGQISFGLNFQSRSVIMKNRTISFLHPQLRREIVITNVHASIGYIEFPVVFGKTISTAYLSVYPYAGASISFPVTDNTSLDRKERLFTDEQMPQDFHADFYEEIESTFGNNPIDFILNIGLEIHYQRYHIDLRYVYDLRDQIWVNKLGQINQRLMSLNLLLGYQI